MTQALDSSDEWVHPFIEFSTGEASLRITLLSRPFPDDESDWDRDVVSCLVSACAPPFEGKFETYVWSHELVALRALLQDLWKNVGTRMEREFELREGTVSMLFGLGKYGSLPHPVTVEIELRPNPARGPSLTFELTTDQTWLPVWAEALDHALQVFPPQMRTQADQ